MKINKRDFFQGLVAGFVLGVTVMAIALMSTSCAPIPTKANEQRNAILENMDEPFFGRAIGEIDGAKVYTFQTVLDRCVLVKERGIAIALSCNPILATGMGQ